LRKTFIKSATEEQGIAVRLARIPGNIPRRKIERRMNLSSSSSSNSLMINTNSLLIDAETLRKQEAAEKKKRRLERNRVSAKQCRARKKEKTMMFRHQLAQLEAENLQLRLKLQVGNNDPTHDTQSAIITTKLDEMMTEGASEVDIDKKIQELKERFSDYGRDRRSAIDFHITQLKRCLQPTQTTRAILWLMALAPRFAEITTGKASALPTLSDDPSDQELMTLWMSILEQIYPTREQRILMISYTCPSEGEEDPFQRIKTVTDTCNNTLDRIVEIICNKNDNLDLEMSNIQNILSPRQVAKFVLWIDRNPACMQMLEALWPHITEAAQQNSPCTPGQSSSSSSSSTSSSLSSRPFSYPSSTSPSVEMKKTSSISRSNSASNQDLRSSYDDGDEDDDDDFSDYNSDS
jgi:hypothetical protein